MQVRTPPLPRNQAVQTVKETPFHSDQSKTVTVSHTAHTDGTNREGSPHSTYSKYRSGIYCSKGFDCKISSPMDMNPEEPHCVCSDNYLESEGIESVLFSILFSPEDTWRSKRRRRRRRDKRTSAVLNCKISTGCSEKCERDASKLWSIQYHHLKPPFSLMLF